MEPFQMPTFTTRAPQFDNNPVVIGSPLSEMDQKREAYIKENALTYVAEAEVPSEIPGIKTQFLPYRPLEAQARTGPPSYKKAMAASYKCGEKWCLEHHDPQT